jgi:hypothetical protein
MSASGDYLTDEWGNPISEGEPAPVVAAPGTPSVFSVDYYRNKVSEFQSVLLEMDAAAAIARQMIQDDVDPEITAGYQADIQAFESKKGQFRAAAEALNFAISGANLVGGGFKPVRVPGQLAALPVAVIAGVAAAVAVAGGLIIWGRDWIAGINQRTLEAARLATLSPEARERVILRQQELEAAQNRAEGSPITAIAGAAKWIGWAVAAYFIWRTVEGFSKRGKA